MVILKNRGYITRTAKFTLLPLPWFLGWAFMSRKYIRQIPSRFRYKIIKKSMECAKGVLRNIEPKFHIVEIRILPIQGIFVTTIFRVEILSRYLTALLFFFSRVNEATMEGWQCKPAMSLGILCKWTRSYQCNFHVIDPSQSAYMNWES